MKKWKNKKLNEKITITNKQGWTKAQERINKNKKGGKQKLEWNGMRDK